VENSDFTESRSYVTHREE